MKTASKETTTMSQSPTLRTPAFRTPAFRAALSAMALCPSLFAQAPLFKEVPAPASQRESAENPFAKRENYVNIDWKNLGLNTRTPEGIPSILNLNLFGDAQYFAERVKMNWVGPGKFDWIGQIGEDDVILAVRDGNMVGSIQKGEHVFEIRSIDGVTHQITESNQQLFSQMDLSIANDLIPESGEEDKIAAKMPARIPPAANGPKTIIDVMVYYNQGVASKNPNMEAYLASLIALSNRSYERSLVPQEIRLVYHAPADKCNSANANTCNNTDPDVVAARKKYGADITGFIYDGSASYCGVSNGNCCMTAIYSCALSNKSFPHEFGHNMGAGHDIAQNNTPGISHGWIDPGKKWRTIMAYPCSGGNCPRIDNFSNPQVQNNGVATGDAGTADNARTMRERMASVAARQPTQLPVGINGRTIVDPPAAFFIARLTNGSLDLKVNRAENLEVNLLSLTGKKTRLAKGTYPAGTHTITWNAGTLRPGVHVLHIRGARTQKIQMLTIMR